MTVYFPESIYVAIGIFVVIYILKKLDVLN